MNRYFNVVNHTHAASTYLNSTRSVEITVWNTGSAQTWVEILDADGDNKLKFVFYSRIPANALNMVGEMCRSIAYTARGKVRPIVENDRTLFLMKECGLGEIYHTTYKPNAKDYGTVWTTDDADALSA